MIQPKTGKTVGSIASAEVIQGLKTEKLTKILFFRIYFFKIK